MQRVLQSRGPLPHHLYAASRAGHYLPEPEFVTIVNTELRGAQRNDFDVVPKGILEEIYERCNTTEATSLLEDDGPRALVKEMGEFLEQR